MCVYVCVLQSNVRVCMCYDVCGDVFMCVCVWLPVNTLTHWDGFWCESCACSPWIVREQVGGEVKDLAEQVSRHAAHLLPLATRSGKTSIASLLSQPEPEPEQHQHQHKHKHQRHQHLTNTLRIQVSESYPLFAPSDLFHSDLGQDGDQPRFDECQQDHHDVRVEKVRAHVPPDPFVFVGR